MSKPIDGMLALVIARDAQSRLAEAELSDHAELAQTLNKRQENLRIVKRTLEKALTDGKIDAYDLVAIEEAAVAAGIGEEVARYTEELYKKTAAGVAGTAAGASAQTEEIYGTAKSVTDHAAVDGNVVAHTTYLWVDENSDATDQVALSKLLGNIREVITDAKEDVKGQSTGQELELQMASQEYSRSTQLASNLLNVRNEVLKSFVQTLRG